MAGQPSRRLASVDYALARRAVLADVFAGRRSLAEVCDAHPYLLRAARYHGRRTERDCPVCRRSRLVDVTYAYSDDLKDASGSTRDTTELPALETRCRDLSVYVVEVCRDCGWNHLTSSYRTGAPAAPGDRRRVRGRP